MLEPRQASGVPGRLVRALDGFNQRHPWSHNDAFHPWILRRLPAARDAALDAGCGLGDLVAALAARFAVVTGVEIDGPTAARARQRVDRLSNAAIQEGSFLDAAGTYDVITMVAVLHHLDHEAALLHAQKHLRPGGRLLVVGLARMATRRDLAVDVASAFLNPVVGLLKHPRPVRDGPAVPPYPVAPPALTLDEVRAIAARVLPGARVKRRLFFRYTLEWTAPGS